ncbi:MAG: VWA domain-containing protein [Spirochaetales bacterium]|nr:VWA domain-containing protein [Spirochaetales bacterium]
MKKVLLVLFLLTLGALVFAATGDVNNDGNINIVDALLTAQYFVGLPVSNFDASMADVNADGSVDIIDGLLIAQYYVGILSSFPADADSPPPTDVPTPAVSTPAPTAAGTSAPTAAGTSLPGVTGPPTVTLPPGVTNPPVTTPVPGVTSSPLTPPPTTETGLEAGYADDNKEFNSFLAFLDEFSYVNHYEMMIYERIIFHIQDQDGQSLHNAKVEVYNDLEELVCEGISYADGSYMFFPAEYGTDENYNVTITFQDYTKEIMVDRRGVRNIDVVFDLTRPYYSNVPLDMVFILDTTGSMGEEITQLKNTIGIINQTLSTLSTSPLVRYGMVQFRDRGDAQSSYLTKVVPLTENLDDFQTALNQVTASGGGDKPEDLEQALEDTMNEMVWNTDGIRLGWIITDAAPKLYVDETYKYVDAARDAHKAGIKFFSIGCGGLDVPGEYALRQLSQYTSAKYIFLTYGETGPSEGGVPGSVSHHTGDDFETDKLESIVLHFAEEELSYLTDEPPVAGEDYFEAIKVDDETAEETLTKLFDMATGQLLDYSGIGIEEGTVADNLPILTIDGELTPEGEYFSDLMNASLAENTTLSMVEDQDLQTILAELELQMSDLLDDNYAVEVGAYSEADVMFSSTLTTDETGYTIVMKLLRVETAEILGQVTAKIAPELGPTS